MPPAILGKPTTSFKHGDDRLHGRTVLGFLMQPVRMFMSPIAMFLDGAMQVVDAQRWTENNFLRWNTLVDSAVSRGTSLLPKDSDRVL